MDDERIRSDLPGPVLLRPPADFVGNVAVMAELVLRTVVRGAHHNIAASAENRALCGLLVDITDQYRAVPFIVYIEYGFERCAIEECILVDLLDRRREDDGLELGTAVEGVYAYLSYALPQFYVFERSTIMEAIASDRLYGSSDDHFLKACTVIESARPYLLHCIGDRYRLEFSVIPECIGTDTGDPVAYNDMLDIIEVPVGFPEGAVFRDIAKSLTRIERGRIIPVLRKEIYYG